MEKSEVGNGGMVWPHTASNAQPLPNQKALHRIQPSLHGISPAFGCTGLSWRLR